MTPLRRKKSWTIVNITSAVSLVLLLKYAGDVFIERATFKPHFVNGKAAVQRGDYDRAIRDLEWIVERDPDWPLARHLLGVAYIKRGEQLVGAVELDHPYSQHKLLKPNAVAPSAGKDTGAKPGRNESDKAKP